MTRADIKFPTIALFPSLRRNQRLERENTQHIQKKRSPFTSRSPQPNPQSYSAECLVQSDERTAGGAPLPSTFDATTSSVRIPNLSHHPSFYLPLFSLSVRSTGGENRDRLFRPALLGHPSHDAKLHRAEHSHTHTSALGSLFFFLTPSFPIQGLLRHIMNSASGRAGIIRARDDAGSMDKLVSRRH